MCTFTCLTHIFDIVYPSEAVGARRKILSAAPGGPTRFLGVAGAQEGGRGVEKHVLGHFRLFLGYKT